MKRLLLIPIAILAILVLNMAILPKQTHIQAVKAVEEPQLDQMSCQYPDRWSNPVNGCDNSDPAVPECTKYWQTKESEDKCIKNFTQSMENPQVKENQPIVKPQKHKTPSCSE